MHGTLSMPLMPAQASHTGLRAPLVALTAATSPRPLEGVYSFPSVLRNIRTSTRRPAIRASGSRSFETPADHKRCCQANCTWKRPTIGLPVI